MRFFHCLAVVTVLFVFCGCEVYDESSLLEDIAPAAAAAPAESGDQVATAASVDSGAAIPLPGVVWLDTDISGWSQTAVLHAGVSGGTLRLSYDKASVWPTTATRASDGGPLNGNCWVIVNLDGTWYAATFDWMRTGQTSKSTAAVRGTDGHIRQSPLNSWTPRSGETYGFMVSTPARTGERTVNQRSNVSMVQWP